MNISSGFDLHWNPDPLIVENAGIYPAFISSLRRPCFHRFPDPERLRRPEVCAWFVIIRFTSSIDTSYRSAIISIALSIHCNEANFLRSLRQLIACCRFLSRWSNSYSSFVILISFLISLYCFYFTLNTTFPDTGKHFFLYHVFHGAFIIDERGYL